MLSTTYIWYFFREILWWLNATLVENNPFHIDHIRLNLENPKYRTQQQFVLKTKLSIRKEMGAASPHNWSLSSMDPEWIYPISRCWTLQNQFHPISGTLLLLNIQSLIDSGRVPSIHGISGIQSRRNYSESSGIIPGNSA